MKRFWILSIVGFVLVVVAVCVVVSSRSSRIRHHLHRMQIAHDAIYAEPSTVTPEGLVGYGSQELFDRHDYHRDRLVELGYYFHATYEMENIPDSEEGVQNALWKLVMASFPDSRHPTLSHPDNVLEVWDVSSRRPDWDAFVKKHDVSDFKDRFMGDAEN